MVVPKTISNDVQPKSSLIMFLIDSSVSGNLSTQFYGSTLVARAIFSCLWKCSMIVLAHGWDV